MHWRYCSFALSHRFGLCYLEGFDNISPCFAYISSRCGAGGWNSRLSIISIWESIIFKVKSIIALSHVNMGDNRIGSQEIGIESMHRIIVPPLVLTQFSQNISLPPQGELMIPAIMNFSFKIRYIFTVPANALIWQLPGNKCQQYFASCLNQLE